MPSYLFSVFIAVALFFETVMRTLSWKLNHVTEIWVVTILKIYKFSNINVNICIL